MSNTGTIFVDFYCNKCGKPIFWVGDTPPEGWLPGTEPFCTCGGIKNKLPEIVPSTPHLMGWECPRCHKIHSPFVTECDCPPPVRTYSDINTEGK